MQITGGNVNDRSPVMDLVKDISAKLIGDKGYISKKLWVKLQKRGKSELQTINSLYFVLIYLHFIKISYNKLSCLNTTCLRRNSICS